jgi:hypothetical protein
MSYPRDRRQGIAAYRLRRASDSENDRLWNQGERKGVIDTLPTNQSAVLRIRLPRRSGISARQLSLPQTGRLEGGDSDQPRRSELAQVSSADRRSIKSLRLFGTGIAKIHA